MTEKTPMTVEMVIHKLQQYPPSMLVLIPGYEQGWNSIEHDSFHIRTVSKDHEKTTISDWRGDYKSDYRCDSNRKVEALTIGFENG